MMKAAIVRPCLSPLLVEPPDLHRSNSSKKAVPTVTCSASSSSSRSSGYIPKREPFSRTKLERAIKDPPLIEKTENQIADYCSTLEGDDSYYCWRSYFELKDLEKELPKEDVERLILQVGGVKSLIGCLHGISETVKGKTRAKQESEAADKGTTDGVGLAGSSIMKQEKERLCPIPDGLPKSQEELEEEEKARMPDSPFTRLLRALSPKESYPAWFA